MEKKKCNIVIHNLSKFVSRENVRQDFYNILKTKPFTVEEIKTEETSKKAFKVCCYEKEFVKLTGRCFGRDAKISLYNSDTGGWGNNEGMRKKKIYPQHGHGSVYDSWI